MSTFQASFNQVGHNYLCHLVRELHDLEEDLPLYVQNKIYQVETSFPTYPHLSIPIGKNGTYTLYFSNIYHEPVGYTGSTRFSITDLEVRETAYLRFQIKFDYQALKTTFRFYIKRVEEVER